MSRCTLKVPLSVDKCEWKTSPLLGQIVLVSTVNRAKIPNVAPKSWISMVARRPVIVGFGCNLKHQTVKNIIETHEFVINFPSEDLAEKVWRAGERLHDDTERIRELGFTLIPSVKVSPPRVEECRAHLECVYDSDKRYENEIWVFGKTMHLSIDGKALEGNSQERYRFLNPIFYLEDKTYGTLGDVKTAKLV